VAETDRGDIVGFQWIGPHPDLSQHACDIATFVRRGQTGLGIGSRLFTATDEAARQLGYGWINAEIRADNLGGRVYYQSRGFRISGHRAGVRLGDGTWVDKVQMRFDLD
jgi:GNAT superfamily N-acetyltransferase